jgi:protein-arginine kinase activator protein McsA
MLCAKCHNVEATIHFTIIVGERAETVDLCKGCAPEDPSAYPSSLSEFQNFSLLGKTCEFCGQPAVSGEMTGPGSRTYWCLDCGAELGCIMSESLASLVQKSRDFSSCLGFVHDPGLQGWAQAATANAVSMLKERKRGNDSSRKS